MSNVIWKYPLELTDEQVIHVPRSPQFLSCQIQNGKPCIWALVDPELRSKAISVYVVGTGNPVPEGVADADFMGTVQMAGGSLVWHVFVEKAK